MADNLRQVVVIDRGAEAAEDLSQYHFVKLDGNGDLAAAADGEAPDGVVVRQFGSGEQAQFVVDGLVPIKVGTAGSLAVGDFVAVDANGQADAGTSADPVAAILVTAPSADGDIVWARISDVLTATETIA